MSAEERTRRSKTGADDIYQKLRDLILRTELKPGQVLVESDLMRRLKAGRTPLRDALNRLAHEGLVDIVPRRGTYVTQVTLSDLQQIFEVRAGIERIVAHLAAQRATGEDVAAMESLVVRAQQAHGPESDVKLDSAFHTLLLEITGNRYLNEVYRRLLDASLRLLYLTGCGMESPTEQVRTFEQAAAALREHDSAALEMILIEHVRAFRDRVSSAIFEREVAIA